MSNGERDINNPLTEEDFTAIEDALTRASEVEAAIKKASRAGIELPGQLDGVRESKKRLIQIKNTYFPGR